MLSFGRKTRRGMTTQNLQSGGTGSRSCGTLEVLYHVIVPDVDSTVYSYLTKITQQTVALISSEHASKIVLGQEEDTKEQDEDVQMRSGFSVRVSGHMMSTY
jgi:hypothetical protein